MSIASNKPTTSIEQTEPTELEPVQIKAPRSLWLDALLFFVTFGFYAVFWLPARIGELKRAERGSFTPWAWIFVPFFWLVQLFALPKFIRAWADWGNEHGLTHSSALSTVTVLLVALSNLYLLFADRIEVRLGFELPYYTVLIAWLTLTIGYTLIAHMVRRVIKALPAKQYQFKASRGGFGVAEWLVVVPLTPFAAFAVYALLANTTVSGSTLPAGHAYVNEEAGFTLTVAGENWRLVPSGTIGDADSVAEFQGPLHDQTIVIYSYEHGWNSMDSLAQWRLEHWIENGYECQETRQWTEVGEWPSSYIECTQDRFGGWQSLELLNLIEHDQGFIELIAFLEARPRVVQRYRAEFIEMVQSLEVL